MNSAVGRTWPANLERDPAVTVVVDDESNPYDDVEVLGTAAGRTEGADAHVDALAEKYVGVDSYPMRVAGEQRISYLVTPHLVRHQKQG